MSKFSAILNFFDGFELLITFVEEISPYIHGNVISLIQPSCGYFIRIIRIISILMGFGVVFFSVACSFCSHSISSSGVFSRSL